MLNDRPHALPTHDYLLGQDETITTLKVGTLRIIQAREGYRFSMDPILLCAFVRSEANIRMADLGTGTGVIPLLLTVQGKAAEIVGIELQPEMADRARRNVELNGMQGRIKIEKGDIRDIHGELIPGSFGAVTCNPPYRPVNSGKIAPNGERARARHEIEGDLTDFLQAGVRLLKKNGRFYMVHLAERMVDVLVNMRKSGLEPKRLRMVHARAGEPANLILVEARKHSKVNLIVEPPLIIFNGTGRDYHPDVLAIYD